MLLKLATIVSPYQGHAHWEGRLGRSIGRSTSHSSTKSTMGLPSQRKSNGGKSNSDHSRRSYRRLIQQHHWFGWPQTHVGETLISMLTNWTRCCLLDPSRTPHILENRSTERIPKVRHKRLPWNMIPLQSIESHNHAKWGYMGQHSGFDINKLPTRRFRSCHLWSDRVRRRKHDWWDTTDTRYGWS